MPDHVEIARMASEALVRKPKPDFDTVNELYAPDHELVDAISETASGGHGFLAWLGAFNETWEIWENRLEEIVAVDDERVLLRFRFTGKGRGSQMQVQQEMASVMTIRDGKVVRTVIFNSPEEARAALAG